MSSRSRFLLSLVVALSLSTLALADSVPANVTFLHSGASFQSGAYTYPGHFSIDVGKAAPVMFDAANNRISTGGYGNPQFSGLLSGKIVSGQDISDNTITRFAVVNGVHNNFMPRTKGGFGPKLASTPEPGSLMLFTGGLMGVAGMMRRKLWRG